MDDAPKAKTKKPAKVYGKKRAKNNNAAVFLQNSSPLPVVNVKRSEPDSQPPGRSIQEENESEREGAGVVSNIAVENQATEDNTGSKSHREDKNKDKHSRSPKKSAATIAIGISTSSETSPSSPERPHVAAIGTEAVPAESLPTPSSSSAASKSHSSPLDDITTALKNLKVTSPTPVKSKKKTSASKRRTRSQNTRNPKPDARLEWLAPLMDAYEQNGHPRLTIKQWEAALDPTWPLLKIAESSYAEVYKVTNPSGTSILKIMALKPPSGPGSRRETACTVESVLSEVLIMDLMAEVPGFLIFRDAHLIEGRPPETMVAAWEGYDWGCALLDGEEPAAGGEAEGRSEFPHPAKYGKDQVFLSLELGDAGMDIEHYPIRTAAELWDIFLGITLALAMGEVVCGFEHRDLHEGNVCVKKLRPPVPCSPAQPHKFGYSGLEVTLLDYTLSRARNTRTGEILAFNLEENQELFYESEMLQRQMYRRMKSWVFFRAHGLTHELLDDEATSYELEHLWKEFHPYTNVIWTYYALEFSIMSFKGEREELEAFKRETEELRERIHPDKRLFDGGFASAAEVRAYCVEKGWLRAEDSNDMLEEDTSIIEKSKS